MRSTARKINKLYSLRTELKGGKQKNNALCRQNYRIRLLKWQCSLLTDTKGSIQTKRSDIAYKRQAEMAMLIRDRQKWQCSAQTVIHGNSHHRPA